MALPVWGTPLPHTCYYPIFYKKFQIKGFTGRTRLHYGDVSSFADYREAFGLFDRVGDNKVAYNQIADIMRALGQNPTNKEVIKMLGNPNTEGKMYMHSS